MPQQLLILFKSIDIKVQFACRLFLQYTHQQAIKRTLSIKILSKQSEYQLNHQIPINHRYESSFKEGQNEGIKVTVKLLSNKGFQFNAGSFIINAADFNGFQRTVKYKISKSGQIDAQCTCLLRKTNNLAQNYGLNQIKEQLERSKNETQQQYLPHQPIKHSDDSKLMLPQFSVVKNNALAHKLSSSDLRTKTQEKLSSEKSDKNRKASFKHGNQSPVMQKHYASRYKDLQKEIGFHGQLFQKQRQIIIILENKYRQALNQQQKLKITLHRSQIELQQKRKRIMNLQEEKIEMMHNRIENQRRFYEFRQSVRNMFEGVLRQINQIYVQKWLQRQLNSKIGEESIKNSRVDSKGPFKIFGNQQSELTENDEFYNYHLVQQSQLNQGNKETSKGLGSKRLRKKCQQLQFDECFNVISEYKDKILKKVSIKTNNISSKLAQLGHTNNVFKLKLKQNTQEFQNNEQALFQYLQELQQGLQTQLQITDQKQQTIFNYLSMIQHLTNKVNQYQEKIKVLQEQNGKLEEEKQFIKSELHQNNYAFSVRQEELMKKLHELQQNAVLPFENIRSVDSKTYTLNVFEEEQNERNQQSLVREYCQRMRSKEMELMFERRQKQKLMQQLENKQQELRYTMLNKKKLQLAIRLKEKLSDASADNHKSFQIHEEQHKNYVQQQFLRILT